MTPYRKKLIEVALPLEAINKASAREKYIRYGHPSTLHLWWARRPLAAARAVIFSSLVDDPNDPEAPSEFVAACKKLPKGKNAAEEDTPRQRLFDFIERLVTWEATTDDAILEQARELIRLSTDGNPPPLLDPFAGGGSINSGEAKPPDFVYAILPTLFVFFNIFAINMVLQYKKVGRWKDYLFGERVYIILSLTSKSVLAWIIFAGTLAPV